MNPELHGSVTLLALLDPSRQDIPEYSEYLGAIQREARAVNDRFQRQGIGSELLGRLIQVGRDEGLRRITAEILPENRGMQLVAASHGFKLAPDYREGVVKAELVL